MQSQPFLTKLRRLTLAVCSATLLALPFSHAADPTDGVPVRWVESRTLAAPEAVQAAAADERFVYAVESAGVAKYDRDTGRRLAASDRNMADGRRVLHLNSAFLRRGRVYCAHSNYPKTPERSEILVLDPKEMKLSTFKDFGEYGGSLTWAVFEGGHWWCNFARYGDANAETFVAKFDEAWRELGRWTYPPEVVRQLGRQSVSGGVWRDGHLVVTGHDDPVLFRLRLPKSGGVLEFVDQSPAPFAGQGIAADPVTGGLVGARRSKRQVVFAAPADSSAEKTR